MTKKTEQEVVKVDPMLPATAADFAGFEQYSASEVLDVERVMPVLQLLQTNSKALVKSHEKFVKGAAAGMFLNRSTGTLVETAVFVPCARQHVFVEWNDADKGGGRVGTFPIDDKRCVALRQEQGFGKLETPEGTTIAETFYVFGYTLSETEKDPVPEPAVLAIKGMSITPYKQFFAGLKSYLLRDADGNKVRNAAGQPINPPLFTHMLRLSAQPKSKNGDDFLVFKFEHLNGTIDNSMVPKALLAIGKRIADDVNAGTARVEEEDTTDTTPAENSAF